MKCCGSDDYSDWFTTAWAGGEKNVPTSCCKDDKNDCKHTNLPTGGNSTALEIYTKVCANLPTSGKLTV